MEHALAKLGLFASVLIVGFLARRPKLPIVLLGTVLPSIALADRALDGRVPLWAWVTGFITASLAFAAIVVAVFITRAGFEGGDFGAIPSGREVHYSESDKDGLLGTIIAMAVGIVLAGLTLWRPPVDLPVITRLVAVAAIAVFVFGVVVFWQLYRDRQIVLRLSEESLGIRRNAAEGEVLVPWHQVAGYRYTFGVFTIVLEGGKPLARVDSTIDGFFALLYHVNRHTFRRV